MYSINKFVFYKDAVIYLTVFEGNVYNSAFNRDGLTNEQAQHNFRQEHFKQVEDMIRERNEHRSKIIN